MRMGVWEEDLGAALAEADLAWLLEPPGLDWSLAGSVGALPLARICATTEELIAQLVAAARPGDHVLIMSNGGFDGIHRRLGQALRAGAGAPAEPG